MGAWERAQDLFAEATRAGHTAWQAAQGAQHLGLPARGDQAMWVEQWVLCCKQLNNWDMLLDYAKGVDNVELQV